MQERLIVTEDVRKVGGGTEIKICCERSTANINIACAAGDIDAAEREEQRSMLRRAVVRYGLAEPFSYAEDAPSRRAA